LIWDLVLDMIYADDLVCKYNYDQFDSGILDINTANTIMQ